MKAISFFIAAFFGFLMVSCHSEPTLQQYFVEHSEKKDFISLDISSSILNVDKSKLSQAQAKALSSFDKMNLLAFKRDDKNEAQFETERKKVDAILKDKKYQQLIKVGSGKDGASVSFVGEDEHIDEFVVYANRAENGFAVVRILGKDMNPTDVMNMISVLKESNLDLEQLKPLQDIIVPKQ